MSVFQSYMAGMEAAQSPLSQYADGSYPTGSEAFQAETDQMGAAYRQAASMMGMDEHSQQAALSDYLSTGGMNIDPTARAWCADFVNATLERTGQKGTGSGMSRSFLNWGQPVDQPQPGDIAVFRRGTGDQGHVGFFSGYGPGGQIEVLGGNQGDRVSVAGYSADDLLGFRRANPISTYAGL